ncbi:hypothetical protein [Chitinophaga filiformis]|uniref:Uncharacterized protein n=1 Tax=Chitinophaga filiformis TaxID=104663 RepID=A0ABY4HVS9_CHIFI|nr:hypothetical protein [Chitinophaga filiformis]UPK67894.1 hypothetical protein MYF79_23360 [Chitinophaga filiformis]
MLSVSEIPQGQSYLTGLNPYDQYVLARQEEIVKNMCISLGIDRRALNGEPNSLDLIDKRLAKFTVDDEFIDSNFLGIYLYLGELLKKNNGGAWKLNYIKQDDLWELIVLDKAGNELAVGISLYEEFENYRVQAFKDPIRSTYNRLAAISTL